MPQDDGYHHQYEVELHDGSKRIVHSDDHHDEWKNFAVFVGALAATLTVAEKAIKAVNYLGKVRK